MKGIYVAAILIALIIGVAAGWTIRPIISPSPATSESKAKFAETPPPGTKIIVGMDAAFPPFAEIDPTGKAVGFDVDVIDWIAEKYGWQIEYKPWDWSTIVSALVEGDIDIIASGMTFNPERSEKVWFTIPYYTYIHEILVPTDESRTKEEILNSGEYIACELGATSDQWAEKLLKEGYNFKKLAVETYDLAFEAVLDGRAIAAISDSAFTEPYFKENPDVAAKFKLLCTLGGIETYAYATRPEDYGLRNALNYGLKELMDSPMWDELKEKWGLG